MRLLFLFFFFSVLGAGASSLPQDIFFKLRQEINKVMPLSTDYKIHLLTPLPNQLVKIKEVVFDPGTYHFQAIIEKKGKDIPIRGSIELIIDIPVLKSVILPGDDIQESDLSYQKMTLEKIPPGVVQKKEELLGKTPKNRPLKPGLFVQKNDLKLPVCIKNTEMVTVIYQDEGVLLSITGQAKQEGAVGDVIQIILPNRKIIQAKVKGKGQVHYQGVG